MCKRKITHSLGQTPGPKAHTHVSSHRLLRLLSSHYLPQCLQTIARKRLLPDTSAQQVLVIFTEWRAPFREGRQTHHPIGALRSIRVDRVRRARERGRRETKGMGEGNFEEAREMSQSLVSRASAQQVLAILANWPPISRGNTNPSQSTKNHLN